MKINKHFTKQHKNPFKMFEYKQYHYQLYHQKTYQLISELKDAEVPVNWTNIANDTMIGKYFRRKGVPQYVNSNGERITGLDSEGQPVLENGDHKTGGEHSVRQSIHRLAETWRYWGEKLGYFNKAESQNFYDETVYLLLDQRFSPNSPQWFNTGLHKVYNITGASQGHYYYDEDKKAIVASEDAYKRPQVHACFIQSIKDDLVNEGGIMDLWVREARLFKYGSGTGTNFSKLRGEGEPLSGGGTSSGVLSFLNIGDASAGSIKSGGTTRRAAKMVILNMDHVDIEKFITWKMNEEKKAQALIAMGYDNSFDGEAYRTVSGQNSNNSVRATDEYMKSLENNEDWNLVRRIDGSVHKTVPAKKLWDLIGQAAWECADPGIQYDTTINEWHTCPAGSDGLYNAPHNRINGSNPCSEYMFLDETACNLASINLLKFYNPKTKKFDIEGYKHACRIVQLILEISVAMAGYPSKEIAERSHLFRTTGIGYANIGTMLMTMGIPYDSNEGRNIAGALTAIMTGVAYTTSAEMAKELGSFESYTHNKEHMLRVIRNHRLSAYDSPFSEFEGLSKKPMTLNAKYCPSDLLKAAQDSWDNALELGTQYGYRNAQVSVIAPTGTIGMQMGCDTTGPEPMFSLVAFKTLVGGGVIKMVNQAVENALDTLGYNEQEIKEIKEYFLGKQNLDKSPFINTQSLKDKGFTDKEINAVKASLGSAMNIIGVFKNPSILTEHICKQYKITEEMKQDPSFNALNVLGFTNDQIKQADINLCGTLTIENAPHLKQEHYAVFDSANKSGKYGIGKRYIHYMGHIKMMAYMQPFLSGAISKTINFPSDVTVEEIQNSYLDSWKYSLKAVAIYRDGCKASQPLNTGNEKDDSKEGKKDDVQLDALGRPIPKLVRLDYYNEGLNEPVVIGGKQVHVGTGEYKDGALAELWITIDNDETLNAHVSRFTKQFSKDLQYGIPLEALAASHMMSKSDPSGFTNHKYIKSCTSIYDFIMKLLLMHYKGDTSFINEELRKQIKPLDLRCYRNMVHKKLEAQLSEITFDDFKEGFSLPNLSLHNHSHNEPHQHVSNVETATDELEAKSMTSGPPCGVCGGDTERNGTCYKCTVCGSTTGCS
jgi:ribonucleoside-diphosphate reductase alpha chain